MMAPLRAAAGRFEGRGHVLPIRIYHEDTDFTGLVYHASYVRFLERGRTDYLRSAGISHRDLLERDQPCAFALTTLSLRFHRSARIDDVLDVHTLYDAVRGPRLAITQRIDRGGEMILDASVEAACINLDGQPRRPPADLLERLRQRLAPPSTAPLS
jgi:acyl-CoA thioester hydrolase